MNSFQQSIEAAIPALRRYARALTRNAEIADDLVQDTLVRALRSEHLFHGGEIRSWLYTILTNLNRNRLRSLARRPTLTPIEDGDAASAGPEAGGKDIERACAPRRRAAHRAPACCARRIDLPGGRRNSGRADRNRDIASGACPHADQDLSRRRAARAAPRQIRKKKVNS